MAKGNTPSFTYRHIQAAPARRIEHSTDCGCRQCRARVLTPERELEVIRLSAELRAPAKWKPQAVRDAERKAQAERLANQPEIVVAKDRPHTPAKVRFEPKRPRPIKPFSSR